MLWQIPLGNSNHHNVANNGASRAGLQGQPPRVFLRQRHRAHRQVRRRRRDRAAVRRGRRRAELVPERHLHRRAALHAEPRGRDPEARAACRWPAAARRGTGGSTGTGGTTGRRTTGRAAAPAPAATPPPPTRAQYNFESERAGLGDLGRAADRRRQLDGPRVRWHAFAGGDRQWRCRRRQRRRSSSPATPAGQGRDVPHLGAGGQRLISSLQPFVLQGASGNWAWTGNWRAIVVADGQRLEHDHGDRAGERRARCSQLGVEVATGSSWTGTIYVDSVSW